MHAYSKYLFILFLINGISLGYLYQFYQGKINHIRLELKNQRNKINSIPKICSALQLPHFRAIFCDNHRALCGLYSPSVGRSLAGPRLVG